MEARSYNHFLLKGSNSHTNSKKMNISLDSSTSRSKFRGGGRRIKFRIPIEKTTLVTILYLTMYVIYPGTGKLTESSLCSYTKKFENMKTCECKPISSTDSYFISLECQSINSTAIFSSSNHIIMITIPLT